MLRTGCQDRFYQQTCSPEMLIQQVRSAARALSIFAGHTKVTDTKNI